MVSIVYTQARLGPFTAQHLHSSNQEYEILLVDQADLVVPKALLPTSYDPPRHTGVNTQIYLIPADGLP